MKLLFGAIILLLLAGCADQKIVRGHILRESVLEQVYLGDSNKQDVLRLLGTPTTVSTFDTDVWYYIGQRKTKAGFLPPETNAVEVHVVRFDENGIAQEMDYYDHTHLQILGYNKTRTPTRGSELTVLQQLFGNFGRFSTPANQSGARDLLSR